MAEPTDDQIWAKVQTLMPLCDCGYPMQPGGADENHPVLVCTRCSRIDFVNRDWADDVVARARELAEAEAL